MTILQAALAQTDRYDDHMDWHDGSGWWMATLMILVAVAVIAVIIWAVVTTTRHTHGTHTTTPPSPQTPNARAILDERFARGEIDTTEYEERRRLLG